MKLHIPTMLLAALLAVQATYTAKADVIYSGHYYDNGKEMCSSLPKPDSGEEVCSHYDDYYCWANAASNLVQYWQDTEAHLNLANNPASTPNGTSSAKPTESPYGTSYLDVYTNFLNSTYNTEASDISAFQRDLLQWYFKGAAITGITDPQKSGDAPGGYYSTAFDGQPSYKEKGPDALGERQALVMTRNSFDTFIKENIGKAGGIVGLDVNRKNPDGQQNKAHAITCVGYEIGADEKISSIIVTDSDDKYFGAFKLQVKEDANGYVALLTDNKVLKQDADDEIYFLGRDYLEAKNYVCNLTAINTPGSTKTPTVAENEIKDGKVEVNTRLTADQAVSGSVTVGDSETVVVLTTDSGKKLTIDGNDSGKPALDITRGALVSVDSLEVTNSPVGGVHAVGNLHIGGSKASGDTATFTDNATTGDGGAIMNESFVDISGNDTVVFSGNHANDKGGAIYSQGTDDEPQTYDNTTVSIRGNGEVVFSGNTAKEGNDIYVEKGAFLNIADNDSVTFTPEEGHEGEAAIVNKGTTYLAAATDWDKINQTITFENCSLNSREGTVVIGQDINNQDSRTGEAWYGEVTFTDGKENTLAISKAASAATLENVLIDATGVYGVDVSKSLVSNVWTEDSSSTGYTLQDLTLDVSATLKGEEIVVGSYLNADGDITLNNVNIIMNDVLFNEEDSLFDLSGTFVASTNFEGAITFDASSLALPLTEDKDLIVQLGQAVNEQQAALTILKFGNDLYKFAYLTGELNNQMVYSKIDPVPEPTTGTLSLLALAGLCARRRRK